MTTTCRWRQAVFTVLFAASCFESHSGESVDAGTRGISGSGDAGAPSSCLEASLSLEAATLSGCTDEGTVDGTRGIAYFANPVNVKLGPSGIAYVADFDSSLLRRVDPDGTVTTFLKQPSFSRPFGMVLEPSGFLLVETDDDDSDMHSGNTGTIWQVNPATGAAQVIARDHGRTRGLALAPDGTIYTSDYVNMVIEHFDPANPTAGFTLVAGVQDIEGHAQSDGSTPSTFGQPWDLVMDAEGDLLVAEFGNNVIRKVTPGAPGFAVVSDYAGTGVAGHVDGPLASAEFDNPKGIVMDASGALYVTEGGNHDVRKIANGMVTTLAGTGAAGYLDDDDPATAEFYGVEGLDVSSDGTHLVVADGNDGDAMPFNHVRVLTPTH